MCFFWIFVISLFFSFKGLWVKVRWWVGVIVDEEGNKMFLLIVLIKDYMKCN